MKVVNYVQIDFSKNKDITVPSMQYDSGSRWVRLKLFNNGIPVNLNGIRVCIMVAKPDGKEVFNDCVIVDAENGLVEFEITNQMVVVAGEVECQIKLMEQDKLLSSEIFTLFVNKGLTPTNIDSENELNVLVDALNRVEHLDQELSGEIMASFEASQTQRDETFKEKLLEYDERFLEIKGEKGDKGDKGDTGERGLQGPVGPQGSKGDVGEQGPVGPQGPKGDKGDQGEVGAIGPIGLQGPIGLTGPQGETGPQGPKGEKGLDGRSVELGVYGGQVKWRYAGQEENVGWTPLISLDSLRGSQGPQGEKGETGPQGPKGEKGDSGGVMPTDMVDYMGNQHETLKAKNDADVDWLLGEINTAHYDGQCITATDSIEGRAKSAILKGQTLVNLATQKSGSFNGTRFLHIPLSRTLKTSTKHFVKFNLRESSLTNGVACRLRIGTNGSVVGNLISDGIITVTDDGYNYIEFYIRNADDVTNRLDAVVDDIMLIEYQEGMENWDIPYFEGMQSVKMPVLTTVGKNLFNYLSYQEKKDYTKYEPEKIIINSPTQFLPTQYDLFLEEGKTYVISCEKTSGAEISVRRSDGSSLLYDTTSTNCKKVFVAENNTFLRLSNREIINEDVWFSNIQIEEGSTATPYEPFKSNILTVNEDVTLRGIGDVRDTLDLMTGEMIQNIGEIVLDGTQIGWDLHSSSNDTYTTFYGTNIKIDNIWTNQYNQATSWICDKYSNKGVWNDVNGNQEEFFTFHTNLPLIRIEKSKLQTQDKQGLNLYLSQNPITLQYQLATESVKTVVFKEVDQDGNETVHENGAIVYSHKDTTHYICGSEDSSLIPSLSIDVPTNLPAVVTRQKTMIHELEVENKALIDELQRVEEKSDQADLEQLSTTWEIDYRVSELEWFVEDNISSTMTVAEKINLKLGGNTMALSRFEQAKILILAGAYNRETLEKQLTNYLKRGYLTTEEYDELIALMDAKELVSEN